MNTAFDDITNTAHHRLMKALRGYKTHPTELEEKALFALLDNFTELASGHRTGRYAWGMPCGTGKTQSIVFWVAEMVRQGCPFSIAVASSQVAALRILKADMVKAGVPGHLIGILSTKEEDAGEPSIVSGEHHPICLVTHARIHMGSGELQRYFRYNGQPRDLLIYDESLITTRALTLDVEDFRHSLAILRDELADVGTDFKLEHSADLLKFLVEQWTNVQIQVALIKNTLANLPEGQEPTDEQRQGVLRLAPCPDVLAEITDTLSAYRWATGVASFLDLCGSDIRVIVSSDGKRQMISFEVTAPEEIKNIAILDASSPIRLLVKMDKHTIHMAETLPLVKAAGITSLADLKDYSNVTLYRYNAGGGYSTFQKDKTDTRIRDAVRLLKNIPPGEPVLFYTFKQRGKSDRDMRAELRKYLTRPEKGREFSYDLDALYDGDKLNPKAKMIEIDTWGRETSFNGYKHCKHVILLGTPHPNETVMRSLIHGQWRDIKKPIADPVLKEIKLSEVVYRVHQATCRGTCRQNDSQGKAQAMSVYIFHNSPELEIELRRVLSGVKVHNPMKKDNGKTKKVEAVEQAITDHLKKTSGSFCYMVKKAACLKVSILNLKRELPLKSSKDTFTRALESYLSKHPEWSREGRSLMYRVGIVEAA